MVTARDIILERFKSKGQIAGGARAGFVLRRDSILYVQDQHPSLDLAAGLDQMVAEDLLKANETKSHYFLTAEGLAKIELPNGD